VGILDAHCAELSRDPAAIERTVSFPIVIRDREADAKATWGRMAATYGIEDAGNVPHLLGSPQLVADAIRPYISIGFTTVICRMPAPFDRETVDRVGEVRELLERPLLGG
jgi:alkanesulfonate monooxygenase SsuD/methylene tetrahydromethanopterin reductase-like flavin-dependent oxidoreductase (luciferase family)